MAPFSLNTTSLTLVSALLSTCCSDKMVVYISTNGKLFRKSDMYLYIPFHIILGLHPRNNHGLLT
ncbi:BgtTE-56113 [Blumeria graminis f. sp. tritici]|uniref:BgtTE-56113 n=1 Tax=Blumeria graminis f. sp. tritici TaxID=62690 RepID=A0A9X9MNY5_BLUGR|nr:BgtTE-56113 [Blumeria graminis f. sp. tritici]